jgi:UDP-3-O-acyl N-acetylglucosamine deacetylase
VSKAKVLVVDDEENIRDALEGILCDEGYEVIAVGEGETALRTIGSNDIDLILLDIWMPGIDGIQTLKILKNLEPDIEVVMMSGHGTIETAVKATRIGAFDFIEKPFSMDKLLSVVSKGIRRGRERKSLADTHFPHTPIPDKPDRGRFVGSSKAAGRIRQSILAASENDLPALVAGEPGLGKLFAARMIHSLSERRNRPLIDIPCSGLTKKKLDSIMLKENETGEPLIVSAEGGSIYLRRIDLLKSDMAKRIATILLEGIHRVGRNKHGYEYDLRTIASCGPDTTKVYPGLLSIFEDGVKAFIPPLRQRPEDTSEFIDLFVEEACKKQGKNSLKIDKKTKDILIAAPWYGNLSELKSFIFDGVDRCEGKTLTMKSFSALPESVVEDDRTEEERSVTASKKMAKSSARKESRESQVRQKTLKSSVVIKGLGLHSGIKTGLILTPLPPDSGIVFGDISTGARIPACMENVLSTDYATTLSDGKVIIKTIEHIMSALSSYQITNLLVKIGDEAPIMDGSALDFCEIIEDAGVIEQSAFIDPIVIDKKIMVENHGSGASLAVEPCDRFEINYHLEYPEPIGEQHYNYIYRSGRDYKEKIAPARTFGFLKDMKQLNEMGLAAGGKLTNVVLIDDTKIINTPLRFPDEPTRHKILDLIGDLYLLGRPIHGRFTAIKSGHTQNFALTKKIKAELLQ